CGVRVIWPSRGLLIYGFDPHRLWRRPAGEQVAVQLVYLDAERPAVRDRVRAICTPAPLGQISTRARRYRTQEVDLGEELEEVAFARRARLHEIDLVHRVEACDLEHIEHVVNVELGEVIRRDRARQVA